MATANVFGGGKQKTFEQQLCWVGITAGAEIHGQLIFLSISTAFLSITAFLGNALILAALRKDCFLHPPSRSLLRSLATTDLCFGIIAEPLSIAFWMSVLYEHRNICPYVTVASFLTHIILCKVSLLTLTAISVDRLLALLLRMRYRQVVTLKRTQVVVVSFWVASAVFSTAYFLNFVIILWSCSIAVLICLVTSTISYTKILLTLRHRQTQLQDQTQQPNQTSPLNITRYKKAVTTAILLQLTMVTCYLPHGIVVALLTRTELSTSVFLASQFTVVLACLSSSLNPILYCWKIEEVRQAVKDTIRQVLCCSSC